jgi:hypothetical protein
MAANCEGSQGSPRAVELRKKKKKNNNNNKNKKKKKNSASFLLS